MTTEMCDVYNLFILQSTYFRWKFIIFLYEHGFIFAGNPV